MFEAKKNLRSISLGRFCRELLDDHKSEMMEYETALTLLLKIHAVAQHRLYARCNKSTRKSLAGIAIMATLAKEEHEEGGAREPAWFTENAPEEL